jgi:hypothetical protein
MLSQPKQLTLQAVKSPNRAIVPPGRENAPVAGLQCAVATAAFSGILD